MSLVEELRHVILTCDLTDAQREQLAEASAVVQFEEDQELFEEGQPADHLWVLLDGEIELTRFVGKQREVMTTITVPGHWAGGHAAWSDFGAVFRVSGRGVSSGRCLVLPATRLRQFVEEWSPFALHFIDAVTQTVRTIDTTARQQESLIALGELAARLAHEINNPASASLRATEALKDSGDYMLASLVSLAELGVPPECFLVIDRLRRELQASPPADGGSLDLSDREEVVGEWLDSRGVDLAWHMAPVLASAGADRNWLRALDSAVDPDALFPAVRWVSSTLGMRSLLDELTDTTSRIGHLVEDVKIYSAMDRADAQRADVRSGIESTLRMLGPKLSGIEVRRSFDESTPEIEVFAAELNQVWTNLIENSLDAMDGSGVLSISTAPYGAGVLVEITDTGPGIDPAILARVFEPFFTTKDVGKGTGLGLDIARRIIVERHGGDIEVTSEPGNTTFAITLPIQR